MLKEEYKAPHFANNHDLIRNYLDRTANNVIKYLYNSAITLSCAESCTGGLLSQMITSISGASAIFELGLCTYSNNIKEKILGVNKSIIETHGAVSAQTAIEMAKRARALSGAMIGIGITGSAGPGLCEGKAAGTVYVGISSDVGEYTYNMELDKIEGIDRESIRLLTVLSVFDDIMTTAEKYTEKC